ncbi:LOW QUALITY PROTEIN: hypothetical protein BRADI_1g15674v3 [Brachypodium distachyon]|uniref:Uncharacterized protein n=1 Tax=Brachypodium distachyon TaxID=15368 RepID=A0A2K2DJN7_BRADI|nr:LOW QUALITY PROTEIN: hypothetical protein BRADI_1g15674v3 [Brachypodium distachyon]
MSKFTSTTSRFGLPSHDVQILTTKPPSEEGRGATMGESEGRRHGGVQRVYRFAQPEGWERQGRLRLGDGGGQGVPQRARWRSGGAPLPGEGKGRGGAGAPPMEKGRGAAAARGCSVGSLSGNHRQRHLHVRRARDGKEPGRCPPPSPELDAVGFGLPWAPLDLESADPDFAGSMTAPPPPKLPDPAFAGSGPAPPPGKQMSEAAAATEETKRAPPLAGSWELSAECRVSAIGKQYFTIGMNPEYFSISLSIMC